jgi:hypothetical protein
MTVLKPGVPLDTGEPVILVEIDPAQPLTVGKHRFQLKVVDDSGNESDPTELVVLVIDTTRPNAVIDGPGKVEFMKSFELSGKRSFDVGGTIAKFVWTLMD